MNFLKKLIATLLVLVITATISTYILSGTLLNAHWLESKASSQHLYSSLTHALPATLVPGASSDATAAQQGLSRLATPNYLQTKVNPFLEQFQDYAQGSGPTPQLDLTDLAAEAQRQGVAIPVDSPLKQPLRYNAPANLKTAFTWFNLLKLVGPIIGLALLVLLILLHRGWHRFTAITKVCLAAAFSQGLLFLLFKLTPGLLDSLIKSKADTGPLAPLVVNFFKSVLGDVATNFGKAAIGLVVIGIAFLIIGLIFKAAGFVGRHTSGDKPADRYARPNPDNRPSV